MYDDRFRSRDQFFRDGPGDRGPQRYEDYGKSEEQGDIYRPSNMVAPFPRRFVSNAEFLEFLKNYLKDLEQETQAVKEAIEELEEVIAEKPAEAKE